MGFKINIGTSNGKTFKLESEAEGIVGKELNENVKGETISSDLQGYEFQISGASDSSGFPALDRGEGVGLQKTLLSYGRGLHKKPRGESKVSTKPKGLRYKKSIRGKVISPSISQINLKVVKKGNKSLEEIFPDQVKSESSEEQENSEGQGQAQEQQAQ